MQLGNTEFAVTDVETTGLFPQAHDRIIEIAIVRVDAEGNILDEFTSLVNPGRDIGTTHLHGITAGDVRLAQALMKSRVRFLTCSRTRSLLHTMCRLIADSLSMNF